MVMFLLSIGFLAWLAIFLLVLLLAPPRDRRRAIPAGTAGARVTTLDARRAHAETEARDFALRRAMREGRR